MAKLQVARRRSESQECANKLLHTCARPPSRSSRSVNAAVPFFGQAPGSPRRLLGESPRRLLGGGGGLVLPGREVVLKTADLDQLTFDRVAAQGQMLGELVPTGDLVAQGGALDRVTELGVVGGVDPVQGGVGGCAVVGGVAPARGRHGELVSGKSVRKTPGSTTHAPRGRAEPGPLRLPRPARARAVPGLDPRRSAATATASPRPPTSARCSPTGSRAGPSTAASAPYGGSGRASLPHRSPTPRRCGPPGRSTGCRTGRGSDSRGNTHHGTYRGGIRRG